jgi:hypothetical protein
MKKFGFPWFLAVLYFVLIGIFAVNWGEFDVLIQKTVYLIAPLTALTSGFFTLRRMGWSGKRAAIIKFVISALVFWFIAEVITLYMTWKNIEPYPSIADVCYWIGYLLFSAAVILEARLFHFQFSKLNKKVLFFLGILFLCIIGVVGFFGIYIGYKPEESLLVNLATISWSIGDLLNGGLALILLALAWEYRDGQVKQAWLWFMGATAVNLIADTLYNMNPSAITNGTLLTLFLDSLWVSGYFLYAGYFLETYRNVDRMQKRTLLITPHR